jgi:hypothetical protein
MAVLIGVGSLMLAAGVSEWRQRIGLAVGLLLLAGGVAGWGAYELIGNTDQAATMFGVGELLTFVEPERLSINAVWRASPERLIVVSVICLLATISLLLRRLSFQQMAEDAGWGTGSGQPAVIGVVALLAAGGVLADDWFFRLGLLGAGALLVSGYVLVALGSGRWVGILLPVLVGEMLLAIAVWSAGTTLGGFETGTLFARSKLRAIFETHPDWLTLWGLGLVAGLFACTQQFPLTWLGPAKANLATGPVTLEMVSKPFGGKVGAVNYREKPATSRVLKQCLIGVVLLQLSGVWLPGMVMLREGQSWLVGLTASPQLPVALGTISWGLLGMSAWGQTVMGQMRVTRGEPAELVEGAAIVPDSMSLALGMGLVGSIGWMGSLSGPIPLLGLVGLACCLASLATLQILVAGGARGGSRLLIVMTAPLALLGLRGLLGQQGDWFDLGRAVAEEGKSNEGLAALVLPGLLALGTAGASGHLLGFVLEGLFPKRSPVLVEKGGGALIAVCGLLLVVGSIACGSLYWDFAAQRLVWPASHLLIDCALLVGGLGQVAIGMIATDRPMRSTSSLVVLITAAGRLYYRDAWIELMVKLPLLAIAQLVRFADWLVVDMLGWGSVARALRSSGRLTLALQHGYWPWYAVLMLVMLTVSLWSVL